MFKKIFLLLLISISFLLPHKKTFAIGKIKGESVVSAFIQGTIPGVKMSIYGYSSPKATVQLFGNGFSEETTTKEDGYFIFNDKFYPFSPKEICLTSQDVFGRITNPVCIPPVTEKKQFEIGPIILPPTISLNKGDYKIGENAILTGQGVPNKEVFISFFTKNEINKTLSLVKDTYAYSIPKLSAKTDKNGDFSISIPTNSENQIKSFAQIDFDGNNSYKSTTLTINIYTFWIFILTLLKTIFKEIINHLLEIVVFIELIILLLRLYKALIVNKNTNVNKSLMILDHSITISEHQIVKKLNKNK